MFKKRGYKRETPQNLKRDYKLFVIACEGVKTEPKYFEVFKNISSRVAIDIIDNIVKDDEINNNKSAPKWVLDRAIKYIDKEGLSKEDELWFVMDVDRWDKKQLKEISDYCNQEKNWHIALSNPCFEVWLYFHKRDQISKSNSCQDFKNEISGFTTGGYSPKKFIPDINNAINNSSKLDSNPNYYMPSANTTKVYKLFNSLKKKISIKEFDLFIEKVSKNLD